MMQHVTEKLHLWLSGEMTAAETAELEDHLAACADCAVVAEQERELWNRLGTVTGVVDSDHEANPSAVAAAGGVWSAVRARTIGRSGTAGLFGERPALGLTLAGGALAAGLLLGFLAPGSAERIAYEADVLAQLNGGTTEGVWLSDGSWLSGTDTDGLDLVWLTAGLTETKDGS